ncbi:MAG: sugar transporter substrate-binding protein [Thermomicrobiales bacterium]|jgi:multiple sugar transport system substrate-binding protein|nr:sugar transporter substrate-binding protein [Thermomicrobiales bacterium]
MATNSRILRSSLDRRTMLKAATGAAAGFCAWGIPGKSYQRALAQESIIQQILAIPGAGAQPTEADMQRVGELVLEPTKANVQPGEFQGQQLTFLGLNNAGLHNLVFRPLSEAWQEYTGATIEWIDLPQDEVFARVQQSIVSDTVDFDILEGGAPWEGDILGKGLASPMPDWVATQVDVSDYVKLLQPPVGTWDGTTYRVSIDADAHNFNYRSDVFANQDLGAEWSAAGGAQEWGVPQTWQQVQTVTEFLNGKELDGQPLYGILDVCAPWGGFGWYFFASRASAYAKHPESAAWLFNPEDMTPYVNNPAFVRAAQNIIDAIPFEPADQVNADGNRVWLEQFLAGIGTMVHWWGDVGSNVYTNDVSVVQDKVMFSILPGSDDVYNNATGEWDTLDTGPNFAPNEAYIGWGLYVMNRADEAGVGKAAWSLAAHLGGKDLGTWTCVYPSGFQPYRTSSFNQELWAGTGLPPEFVASYLASQQDSYDHPNGAIEPRIPGIFQYYVAAEIELSRAFAGEITAQEALDNAAAQWEQITDDIGRDSQIALYQAALG